MYIAVLYYIKIMKNLKFLWLLPAVILCMRCGNSVSNENERTGSESPAGNEEWTLLFDGNTIDRWRSPKTDNPPEQGWTVSDSTLLLNANEGEKGGDLITREEYGNFILEWEWKMFTKGGNSGVKYFVKTDTAYQTYGPGLEYQILDDDNHEWMLEGKMKPGDYHTLAALYELYPAKDRTVHPLGEWNTSRIVSRDEKVEHWLNGIKVLQFERGSEDFRERVAASKFAKHPKYGEQEKGHIVLQDHGSQMAFRNIRIRTFE